MLSPIEVSQIKLKRRQSLPRGYFKKRKPDRHHPLAFYTFPSFVNWSGMLSVAVLLVMMAPGSDCVGVDSRPLNNHPTTLEPSLSVLSLEKPLEASPNETITPEKDWFNNTNGSE